MNRHTWKICLCYYSDLEMQGLRQRILDFLDDLIDSEQIDWYGVEESTERMGING